MLKKHKVVMLPTNEKAQIGDNVIVKHNTTLAFGKKVQEPYNMIEEEQHLYILSDEEKIIATTDLNLSAIPEGDTFAKLIPEIPQSFIEKFVEEYNRGNVITDVMVEYIDNGEEDWIGDDYTGEPFWNEKIELKINPKDNTITIRECKDSWSKEEVYSMLVEVFSMGRTDKPIGDFNKWIEENL